MKRQILACLGLFAAAAILAAAAFQPAIQAPKTEPGSLPAISIQEIETDSPEDYALWIAKSNKAIYEKYHIENYTRVMLAQSAGEDSGKVFAVQTAESFAKHAENGATFENDPALVKLRAQLSQVRKLGSSMTLKAVRFEGRNANGFTYNTRAVLTDEGAYLKSLDGLRGLLDSRGFKDAKINCYRVVSGRSDYSHLISINCPSAERRAAMLDSLCEPWGQDWIASVGKIRTVVGNGTFKEITQ